MLALWALLVPACPRRSSAPAGDAGSPAELGRAAPADLAVAVDLGTGFVRQESGTQNPLASVWGASALELYAVGLGGTILHTVDGGGTWTAMASGTIDDLEGVWGRSPSDVWAVGILGTVLHFDGVAWRRDHGGEIDLGAVWGSGGEVYAVGDFGSILHKAGAGAPWVVETAPTQVNLNAVWGSAPGDVYAVGDQGVVLHTTGNGVAWKAQSSGTKESLRAVWGSGGHDVWAAGGLVDGVVLHGDGAAWSPSVVDLTGSPAFAIGGRPPDEVWIGGAGGAFAYRASGVWSRITVEADTIYGLWEEPGGRIYAVGRASQGGGLILRGPG